jgi:glucosamine--fructose-6-phosphate aminotransferase (isomerizing)
MTRFLDDILRQPHALASTLEFLGEAGLPSLRSAAAVLGGASHIYMTGIGSSYYAALGAASHFHQASRPVYVLDAAELLHFAAFPRDSVLIIISRSGQSVEIVNLLRKAREEQTMVIGLTNAEKGFLAEQAQIPIVIPADFDHAISVNTYSTLVAAACALASATLKRFDSDLQRALLGSVDKISEAIPTWREQIAHTSWFAPESSYYFLARGASLASCNETRLLWEEGAKHPATSMGTSAFRHGPQEIAVDGSRFGLWIDPQLLREEDLAVARDLRKLGASVMLIGHDLPGDSADLVFQIPLAPPGWQFLFDIIPAQFAAEHLANLSNVDCDSFRVCSYIVRGEFGLLNGAEIAPQKDS